MKITVVLVNNNAKRRNRGMSNEKNTLSYRQIGDQNSKITLVFLHGSTMTKEGMLPLAERFTKYNCIVFDLTAHGESAGEEPEEVRTFAENVEQSVEYLQQSGVIGEKMVLLGYSMGGAITCEIAIRKKLKLAGIVFLSSGADLKHYTPAIDELKKVPVAEFKIEDILGYAFGKDTSEEEKQAIIQVFSTTNVSNEIGYGDLMASNRYDRLEASKDIDIPALIVHGNDDRIVLSMAAVETWKAIPGSELLMLPYKGHAAIMEDGETIKNKIMSFVEKLI